MTVVVPSSSPGLNDREARGALLETLRAAVKEIQDFQKFKLRSAVVAGAATNTNIAIAGIVAAEDRLVSVVQHDIAADTGTSATGNKVQDVIDRTSEASITSNGNIQLSTTNTTGDKLVVIWYDASATS